MKIKLDENVDVRLVGYLLELGIEADTVYSEGISGSSDETIYEICLSEKRCLVTFDLDFSHPLRFPPEPMSGIIILRPQSNSWRMVKQLVSQAIKQFDQFDPKGQLWIVEPTRIRVYDPNE